MDSKTNIPQSNTARKAVAGNSRKKGNRKWGAGIIAATIAMAWSVGGLVLPSMAADGTVLSEASPQVTVSNPAVTIGAKDIVRDRYITAVDAKQYPELVNYSTWNDALSHFGDQTTVGGNIATYMPLTCVIGQAGTYAPGASQIGLETYITQDKNTEITPKFAKFGVWVLSPKGTTSADITPAAKAASSSTQNSTSLQAQQVEASSATESGATQAALLPAQGSAQATTTNTTYSFNFGTFYKMHFNYSKVSYFQPNPGESLVDATARLDALIDEIEKDAAAQLETEMEQAGLPENLKAQQREKLQAAVAQMRDKAHTDLAAAMSGAGSTNYTFNTSQKLELKYNSSISQANAERDLEKQLATYRASVLAEFEQWVKDNNIPADSAATTRAQLNAELDKVADKARAWLKQQYGQSSPTSEYSSYQSCYDNGPIVPAGSLVLVPDNNSSAAFILGQTASYPGVGRVNTILNISQYAQGGANENQSSIYATINGKEYASFCVEPFDNLNLGTHNAGSSYTGGHWAENNAETAHKVKALAWYHYQGGASYAQTQNAIWQLVMGFPNGFGLWDNTSNTWVANATDSSALINAALNAYDNRVDVATALRKMRLVQESSQVSNTESTVTLKLEDYTTDAGVRSKIGTNVYVYVKNATYADGRAIPNGRLELTELEKGVTLKTTNQDAFKVGFAGKLSSVEDAYFLDSANPTQAQVSVIVRDITVDGELDIKWVTVVKPTPTIGTTASVDGQAAAAPEILPYVTSGSYTLRDAVQYENLSASSSYQVKGELKRIRGGQTTIITTGTYTPTSVAASGSGTWSNVFSYTLSADQIQPGDKFYFTEKLLENVNGTWTEVASHTDPVDSQTVIVKNVTADLQIEKAADGETGLVAGKNLEFQVKCGKDPDNLTNTWSFTAPAAGGVATTRTVYGYDATKIALTPGHWCQVTEKHYASSSVSTSKVNWGLSGIDSMTQVTGGVQFQVPAAGASIKAKVTNTYSAKTGGFTLEKFVHGTDHATASQDDSGKFNFDYTCENNAGDTVATGSFDVSADTQWKATVNGLPHGAICEITEVTPSTPQGFDPPTVSWLVSDINGQNQATNKVTIAGNTIAGVGAVNTYTAANAAFSLQKVAQYSDGTAIEKNFIMEYECSAANGSSSTGSKVVKANGDAVSITNGIKAGMTCKVWEDSSSLAVSGANFKDLALEVTGGVSSQTTGTGKDQVISFQVPAGGNTAVIVKATNTYDRIMGSFKLSKAFNTADNPLKDNTFKFDMKCDNGTAKTIQVTKDSPYVSDEYPVGTKCTLTEQDPSTAQATSEVSWSGAGTTPAGTQSRVITIEGEKVLGVIATNNVTTLQGKIAVTKQLSGDAKDDTAVTSQDFKFILDNCTNGVKAQEVTVKAGKTATFTQMPVGTQCDLHEETQAFTGITSKLSWNTAEISGKPGYVRVTVPAQVDGQAQTLSLTGTNNVVYDTASFKIVKTVSGFETPNFDAKFKFTYECSANGKTYTQKAPFNGQAAADYIEVAAGQASATISVPAGATCTVTEDGKLPSPVQAAGDDPVVYDYTDMTVGTQTNKHSKVSPEFTAEKNTLVSVSAKNVYRLDVAGFTFEKSDVTGNAANAHQTDSFTFKWMCKAPSGKITSGSKSLTRTGSSSVTDLPLGTQCVMWEENSAPYANETQERQWTVGGKAVAGKTLTDASGAKHADAVEFTVADTGISIDLVNDYSVPTTSLELKKDVVKDGEDVSVPSDKSFVFDFNCTYSADTDLAKTFTKTIKDGNKAEVTGIPVGSTCSITERNAALSGHNWSVVLKSGDNTYGNGSRIKLNSSAQVSVTATNTYAREFGSFHIAKTVTGGGDITTQPTYQFTYTCSDPNNTAAEPIKATFNLGDKEEKTFNGIPVGYKCEITEDALGDKVLTEKWSKSIAIDGIATSSFTIGEEGQKVEVLANNNFSDTQGNFTLTKKLDSASTASLPTGTVYNFDYSCSKEVVENNQTINKVVASGKISLTKDETKTVTGIPTGAKCEITETAPTDAAGNEVSLSGIAQSVKWDYTSSNDATIAPIHTAYSDNLSFGISGESTDQFVIGKHATTGDLVATNKLEKKSVKLKLKKEAVAKARGDYSTDPKSYTTKNFTNTTVSGYDSQGVYRTWNYMSRNYVEMKVTCDGKDLGVYQVPVNGDTVTVNKDIPYGANCTVAEKDAGFNDYYTFVYGAWNHKVDMSVADSDGSKLAADKTFAFAMTQDNGYDAAIDFNVNTEAEVTVNMKNKWDCFYSVTSELEAKGLPTDVNGEGVRTVTVPSDPTARIQLTDTVTYSSLPKGEYVAVGRLYDLSQRGKVYDINKGYLTWTDQNGKTRDHMWVEMDNTTGTNGKVTKTMTYNVSADFLAKHPNGIGVAVMIYKDPYGWNDAVMNACDANCYAIASEMSLPVTQSIIPVWEGELKTQALNAQTKTNVLNLGETTADQKVSDTVTYTNIPVGTYDLYARIVQVGKDTTVIGDGNQQVTTATAGSNKLASGQFVNSNITVSKDKLVAAIKADGNAEFVTYEFLLPKGQGADAGTKTVDELKKAAVASHVDKDEVKQQLFAPAVETTATVGEEGGTHVVTPETTGTVTVVDKVEYTNLVAGKEYTLTGTLHVKNADGTDGGVLDDPGATKTIKFTPAGTAGKPVSGSVNLSFEVQAASLKTQTVVAFEEVKDGTVTVATHADITDEDQTIYSPSLRTTADVANTEVSQTVQMGEDDTKTATITDKVDYTSLEIGKTYVIVGQLMKLKIAPDGTRSIVSDTPVATATDTFTPATAAEAVQGQRTLTFADVKVEAGTSYVVFETLYTDAKVVDGKVTGTNGEEPTKVAEHADPKDPAQAVYAPDVTTDAKEGDDKFFTAGKDITITDVATYYDLIPGKTYTMSGKLHIKNADGTDGGTVKVGDQELVVSKNFVADKSGTGTVELVFTIPAADAQEQGLVGKSIVAFEEVLQDGKTVVTHQDITDGDQTVYSGTMRTTATDKADGNKTVLPGQNAVITDTVEFSGELDKGTYTLVGVLHYTDGTNDLGVVPGVSAANVVFTLDAPGNPGTQTMEFTVPAESIVAGKDMVVYEYLYVGEIEGDTTAGEGTNPSDPKPGDETPIITHEDPTDPAQTVTPNPVEITTTAYDGASKDKDDKNLDTTGTVTIYDLVDYTGLEVGHEYTVTGTLMYQDGSTEGTPVPADKYTVTPVTFTANKANSTDEGAFQVIVKFEVDKAALTTAPMVVFEDLQEGEVTITTHHDIADEPQTVYNPGVGTTATVDEAKTVTINPDDATQEPITVTDHVVWTNLAPGEYTLYGQLFQVVDGKVDTAKPVDTKEATVTSVFGTPNGETNIDFTVPAKLVKPGVKFVVYERLVNKGDDPSDDDLVVAKHEDPTDPGQTVTVKSLDTTLVDGADGDHVADVTTTGKATVIDRVDYAGLDPEQNYTVTGELMYKDGSETGTSTGITKTVKIGPAADAVAKIDPSGNGYVLLEFEVTKTWVGKSIVAFETVREEGSSEDYLIHHDINDDDQTVDLPGVKTQARADSELGVILVDADTVVYDTVSYTNLKVGTKYVVTGELVKPDGTKTGITAFAEFTATETNPVMKDQMKFVVPAGTVKEGESLVVFETLWLAEEVNVKPGSGDTPSTVTPKDNESGDPYQPAATHQDPTDPAQTVGTGVSPKIATILSVAGDREAGSAVPTVPAGTTQLTDVVKYQGLTPGVQYTLKASLMEISLTDPAAAPVAVAEGTHTFTPTASAGATTVTFRLASADVLKPGYKYVAFEYLFRTDKPGEPGQPGEEVAEHEDPKDPDQTVESEYNPSIATILSADGKRTDTETIPLLGWDGKTDITVVDVVKYQGLKPGVEYVMDGSLQKVDGKTATAVNAVSEPKTFTPETANGTVELRFTIPAAEVAALMPQGEAGEISVVAFEKLWEAEQVVVGEDAEGNATVTPGTDPETGEPSTPVASHEDPKDPAQTVIVTKNPAIATTLEYNDGKDPKVVFEANTAKLTDTVEYFNLKPNTQYVLQAQLMGVPVGKTTADIKATGITGTTTFTTPAASAGSTLVSGTAEVVFTVPLEVLQANDKLVAFERLFIDANEDGKPDTPDTPTGTHEDPEDPNQTVTVKHPGVGTIAKVGEGTTIMTWEGANSAGETAPDTYTITDTVEFTGLEVGKTYALSGQVYDKTNYVEGTSQPLTAAVATFTPKTVDGQTTMQFQVERSQLSHDSSLVVFEQLWAPGTFDTPGTGDTSVKPTADSEGKDNEPVATHNDINSGSQTVTVNKPTFGQLTLVKTVDGWNEENQADNVTESTAQYDFTVTCGDQVHRVTLKKDESKTITGIPLGAECTIVEDTQLAFKQAGLAPVVTYTEANGVTVTAVENGTAKVTVGGTADGTNRVNNVVVTANNHFVPEPYIGTDTSAMSGKTVTNSETFTDFVTYKHLPAGNYLVHTYFMEYVDGVATKIDYVPSYLSTQEVKGTAPQAVDGYDGTWAIPVTVPADLVEIDKKLVIWEDVYSYTTAEEAAQIKADLAAGGEVEPYLSHHENTSELGEGYQWFDITSNYGGFQVTKEMVTDGLKDAVVADLPTTFNFHFQVTLPEGGSVEAGTPTSGDFQLTVDSTNPAKAISQKFEGYPVGTKVTITETGVEGTIPTLASMATTWKFGNGEWTNGVDAKSVTLQITAQAEAQVTAVNTFTPTNPEIATLARTVDGGKQLKPSEDTPVLDTVTYTGLVEGRQYWLKTELRYVDTDEAGKNVDLTTFNPADNAVVLGADGQPLVRWTLVTAGPDNSEWVVDEANPLVVPANADPARDVVFYEYLYEVPTTPGGDTPGGDEPGKPGDDDTPIAEHEDPTDESQIITRRPELSMGTVAGVTGAETVLLGEDAVVTDEVTYNGLRGNATYTLVGQLVKQSDGTPVGEPVTLTDLRADADGSGTWFMELPVTAQQMAAVNLTKEDALVVFERAYLGNQPDAATAESGTITPVVSHEDRGSAPQTVMIDEDVPPTAPPVESETTTPGTTLPPDSQTPSKSTSTIPSEPPVAGVVTLPPSSPKLPPVLARTGAQAATVGFLAVAMMAGGALMGLYAGRRKRATELD